MMPGFGSKGAKSRRIGNQSASTPSIWSSKKVQLSPELLRRIFEHLSDADNARNARVCRGWRDDALGLVWRCVDLGDALQLLAPLFKKGAFYKFVRSVSVQDWERFDVYANRVRQLTACPKKQYDPSVGRVIGCTRQRLEIFPGLKALAFESNFHLVPLFLHHGVKQLSFIVDSLPGTEEVTVTLPYIAPSVPTLKYLTVTTHHDFGVSLDIVVDMIKYLGHLQSLRLPLQWLTPTVISELVYHDELSYLGITAPAGECFEMRGPENDVFSITMPKRGGIPSLTELNLAVGISSVEKCLPHLDALRTLTLLPPQAASSQTIGALLQVIPERAPSLTSLTIDFRNSRSTPTIGNSLTYTRDLKPLVRLKSLNYLHLDHIPSISVRPNDLVALLKKLPELTHLALNPHPSNRSINPSLKLLRLPDILRLNPKLEYLGLYMGLPKPTALFVEQNKMSNSLKELHFGHSILPENSLPVAIYLSHILPVTCKLTGSSDTTQLQEMFETMIQFRGKRQRAMNTTSKRKRQRKRR